MFYSLLFSLFSMVSSYMISGGIGTAVSSLLAQVFTVGKPRLVVVAVQGAPAMDDLAMAWFPNHSFTACTWPEFDAFRIIGQYRSIY